MIKILNNLFVLLCFVLFMNNSFVFSQENSSDNIIKYLNDKVPEIGVYSEQLNIYSKNTKDSAVLIYRFLNIPDSLSSSKENGNYYQIYVGESHKTHIVRWNTFYLSQDFNHIYVYNVNDDKLISLEEWRKSLTK